MHLCVKLMTHPWTMPDRAMLTGANCCLNYCISAAVELISHLESVWCLSEASSSFSGWTKVLCASKCWSERRPIANAQELFKLKHYNDLDGGILEGFGRLLKFDLKIYVYPTLDTKTGEVITATNVKACLHILPSHPLGIL